MGRRKYLDTLILIWGCMLLINMFHFHLPVSPLKIVGFTILSPLILY